jgi:hypothetical protein
VKRAVCAEWPRILNPAPGCFPPVSPLRQTERVLHVALRPEADSTRVLPRAFSRIASAYAAVDWQRLDGTPDGLIRALEAEACRIRPTLVWMQMQAASSLDREAIALLRRECDPSCVIMQWDGDLHFFPGHPQRRWFSDLGQLLDASLTCETHYQELYATELGVKHPGFLEVGVDEKVYKPYPDVAASPHVVFLGSFYPQFADGYAVRGAVVEMLAQKYGPQRFAVRGTGWGLNGCAHVPASPLEESFVYASVAAALSISIYNYVTRYTSDRLFRMLASGAVSLVERFPDCEGLGLVDGENCFLWSTWAELSARIDELLIDPNAPRWREMRTAAVELSKYHTWDARMEELLALVDAIRSDR